MFIVGADTISLYVWEEELTNEEGTHWSVFAFLKLEITHLQRSSNDSSATEVEADRLLVKEKLSQLDSLFVCLNSEVNYIGWQSERTKQNKREYKLNRWSTFDALQNLYPFPTKYNPVFYNINPPIVFPIWKLFWSFNEINSHHNQAMVDSQFVLSHIACSVLPITHPP